jgi:hypothetical protein
VTLRLRRYNLNIHSPPRHPLPHSLTIYVLRISSNPLSSASSLASSCQRYPRPITWNIAIHRNGDDKPAQWHREQSCIIVPIPSSATTTARPIGDIVIRIHDNDRKTSVGDIISFPDCNVNVNNNHGDASSTKGTKDPAWNIHTISIIVVAVTVLLSL